MMSILPMDEINALEDKLRVHFEDGGEGRIRSKEDMEDILDELLDLFLLAYAMGVDSIPGAEQPPLETVKETLYKKIEGKNWEDRVREYYEKGGTLYDIARIASTEAHRDANAAAYDAARASGLTEKQWHCMMFPTSRDDHVWLDGVTAPIDGYFFSPAGDMTQYPGEWGVPEQDVNCLCWLSYR